MLEVERIVEETMAANEGEYKRTVVRDKVAEYLQENPDPEQPYVAADKYLDRYEQTHKARAHGKDRQATLFDADALLILGDGIRVKMAQAKQRHVIAAARIRTAAHAAENADFERDMNYLLSRVAAFRNDTETLAEVEERDFGWQTEEEPEEP